MSHNGYGALPTEPTNPKHSKAPSIDEDDDSETEHERLIHQAQHPPAHQQRRQSHNYSHSRSRSRLYESGAEEERTGLMTPNGEEFHLASVEQKRKQWWRDAAINGCFIAGWFFFATLLSVYNKWMFSPDRFAFPYPIFVTSLHMVMQFVLAAAMRYIWPKHFKPDVNPNLKDYATKAVPTGVTTSFDIGLSNLSLKFITLSFYTMCKSSSLIFVLLFAFVFRLESFSWKLVVVISLIFAGVLLMVATETQFHLAGLIMVLSASAFGGLRWALTQILLRKPKMGMNNPAATVFWLAPCMGVTLAVVSMIVEGWRNVFALEAFNGFLNTLTTLGYLITPGTLAFCMVMSEYYIIQRAGVVPMSIAGIFKEVTTITVSAWVFGDELTPLNMLGVFITTIGIATFTHHKYQKALSSTVPLDAHGNPLPIEEAEEILQTATRIEFGDNYSIRGSRSRSESLEDVAADDTERIKLRSSEELLAEEGRSSSLVDTVQPNTVNNPPHR